MNIIKCENGHFFDFDKHTLCPHCGAKLTGDITPPTMREKFKEELKKELKEELKKELKEELKKELKEELKKELKEELKKELKQEIIPQQ